MKNTGLKQTRLTEYDQSANIDNRLNTSVYDGKIIFGHSDALNSICGYWVIVVSYYLQDTSYVAQIAIGETGTATRFRAASSWKAWTKL